MKKSQLTDLLATIKATAVSFFSIMMFVALAVAIFLGIEWSGKALGAAGEDVFEQGRFHDIELLFPYGFADSDIDSMRQLEGVDEIEVGHVSFSTIDVGDKQYHARVNQLNADIDKTLLSEGSLPQEPGQIAFETYWAAHHDISVGDVVTIVGSSGATSTGSSSPEDGEYTVTGLVDDPSFISASGNTWGASGSSSGSVDALVWVIGSAFSDIPGSVGTRVVIRSNALRGMGTLDDAYIDAANELASRVKALGSELSEKRHAALVEEAEGELEENRKKLADAQAEIENGEQKLAEAESQIGDGKQKLEEGMAELADGQARYDDAVYSGKLELETAESELAKLRDASASAASKLANGKAEYDAAAKAFEEKKAALDEAEIAYASALAELETEKAQYDAAMKALDEQERAIPAGDPNRAVKLAEIEARRAALAEKSGAISAAQAELDATRTQLDSLQSELAAAEGKLAEMKAAIDVAQAETELLEEKLASGEQSYASAEAEYWTGVEEGGQQLSAAYSLLEEGRSQLSEAESELEGKREELERAKAEFAEGEAALADAEDRLEQLRDAKCSWTVLGRAENGGVVSMSGFTDITRRLRTSMASLFVLVGLFVCYSAVSRLVREHIRQIGAKKALGMRAREITASYLMYSGAAVLIGCVAGLIAAVAIVERIIVPVLASSFFMPAGIWWNVPQAAAFCLAELVLVLICTWGACRSVLRRHAVELLAGGAPPSSKERFFESWKAWKTLSLYTQSTINNLLNDKRRVVGTLIGVAGCTALVVCALTLNNDVIAGFHRQYEDVYHYDTIVRADPADGGLAKAAELVEEQGCEVLSSVSTHAVSASLPDGTSTMATITVPEDAEAFSRAVTMTPTSASSSDAAIEIGADGVWVSNSYAEHQNAKPGDVLNVTTGDGSSYQLPIAGFYRHYLSGYQVIMSKELYKEVFGFDAQASKLLIARKGADYEALKGKLEPVEYISAVIDDKTDQETLFNTFRKVSRVVVMVYLALSFAMALVVLLNLNFMFVEEKRRDLITLMVCGYSVSDAKRYIWRDNVVLTVLGIAIGVLLGMIAGWAAVCSMELGAMSLVKTPDAIACLLGIAVSGSLSCAMTLIALRRVSKLELPDINKS